MVPQSLTHSLFVVYMGKEAKSQIKVDVSNIVWTSSKGDEKSRETGVDVAILKLVRPLRDKPSVAFLLSWPAHSTGPQEPV